MSIFAFLILGAIAGAVARKLMPGRSGKGLLSNIIFGAAGAMVGGWLSSTFLHVSLGTFWDLRTWVIAIVGAVLVLFVWGLITGKGRK